MRRFFCAALMGAFGMGVSGQALAEDTEAAADPARYLIMEPNAQVIFITTGGAELRADWTAAATENLWSHMDDQVGTAGYDTVLFDTEAEQDDALEQLLLLYELVAISADSVMPHKGGFRANQEITLGQTASLLAEAYDVDRAIFVDHYSQIESGGVFLTQVMIGTATGYTPPSQNIRATTGTVIDLESGDILERNSVVMGDPRDLNESAGIISRILRDLPLE